MIALDFPTHEDGDFFDSTDAAEPAAMAGGNLLETDHFNRLWHVTPDQTARADGSYMLASRNGGAETTLRLDMGTATADEETPDLAPPAIFDDAVSREGEPLDIRGFSPGEQLDFSALDTGDQVLAEAVRLVDMGREVTGVLFGGVLVALIWAVESHKLRIRGTRILYERLAA